ncbi:hypothetical protein OAB94_02190 [Flavobacteriaceae bacterium]|nr:hypothetical protein [Flavobacteriaceae bacterium]
MNTFSSTDLSNFTTTVAENAQQLHAESSKVEKKDSGTIRGIHLTFLEWNTNARQCVPIIGVPMPKENKYTKKDGSVGKKFRVQNKILVTKIIPGPTHKPINETETQIKFSYSYGGAKPKKEESSSKTVDSRAAIEGLREQIWDPNSDGSYDYLKPLIDVEGILSTGGWHQMKVNTVIEASFVAYNEKAIRDLHIRGVNGNNPIRCGVPVRAENMTMYKMVNSYVKYNDDGTETLFIKIGEPQYSYGSLMAYSPDTTDLISVLAPQLETSDRFLSPIIDVQAGNAEIQQNIIFRLRSNVRLADNTVMRTVVESDVMSEFLTSIDKGQNIRRQYLVTDRYANEDGSFSTYSLTFLAWAEQCSSFGIDSEPEIWHRVMQANQSIDCVLFAYYAQKKTMELECNSVYNIGDSSRGNDGSYQFGVTQILPDYQAWFARGNGYLLTADDVKTIFKSANIGVNRPMYSVSTIEIDENNTRKRIEFKSVLDGPNQLHVDGMMSRVLCLGSGKRPTINCDDASCILDNEFAEFYAIASDKFADTSSFLNAVENEKTFYQIFVIQNREKRTEKKTL